MNIGFYVQIFTVTRDEVGIHQRELSGIQFVRDGKFCALFFNYHPPIRIIGLFFCFTMLNIPGNKFDKKKRIKHTLKFFDQTTAASAQGLGFGLGHVHCDHNDEKV